MNDPDSHRLEDIQERAALFSVGALEPDEAEAFEKHLASGCELCRSEVLALQRVTEELAATAAAVPPPSLRHKVLARVASHGVGGTSAVSETPGFRFVRSGDLRWHSAASEIETKRLNLDRARGQVTQLIRMAPGARLPSHRHAGPEQSYIVSGELILGDVRMHAGDYCLAEPDTVHDDVWTETGCTFIAVSSLHDEYRLD